MIQRFTLIISLFAMLTLVSCQSDVIVPTLAQLSTPVPTQITPTMTATFTPTSTVTEAATATLTPSPTITDTPGVIIQISLTPSDTPIPPPPTQTATPLPEAFTFGHSAQGRDLLAYRFGTGQHIILLAGGIHAGFEANTVDLMNELRSHFALNPQAIERDVTLLIVPAFNPDGLTFGRVIRGRFNGNQVDLNRNWGCDWSENAEFNNGAVDPGAEPFSEPETTALGSLIQRVQPAAVMFYHAAANGIFAGDCETGGVSDELAQIYGEASRYPYGEAFSAYRVTGTAVSWIDGLGIPAVDVELASSSETEFNRNLQAILAVQQWIVGR
ncbi:MAG: DUF2817 domain-containing protein [Anaerolineae bacterium]|nr:DUF2817 domain-containing protein [Anaerolineae bacterium]MDQ7036042.1 DUF2817 domain-containing protein [Anaerolineae bacterium]